MDIEQAKKKLAEIKRSTGTKHVKTLVSELCDIIGFLFDQMNLVSQKPRIDPHKIDGWPPHIKPLPHNPKKKGPLIPCQPPWPNRPEDPPIRRRPSPPPTMIKTNTDGGTVDRTDVTDKDSEHCPN